MDSAKKQATSQQITALMDYMNDNPELSKGLTNSGLERDEMEAQWRDLANTLNSLGGAVKSVEKWKQTWRDVKSNTKKRALKQQFDTSGTSADNANDQSDDFVPYKKKYMSFDDELLRIEREKLEVDREYKVQKIEALSRIASALEEIARKKDMK